MNEQTTAQPEWCERCGHQAHPDGPCDHEVQDWGDMDCGCSAPPPRASVRPKETR